MANGNDLLSNIGSTLGRGVLALGTGGLSELVRAKELEKAENRKRELQQIGQALSGTSLNAPIATGGAGTLPATIERTQLTPQEQIDQLAQIGTPNAIKAIQSIQSQQPTELDRAKVGILNRRQDLEEDRFAREEQNRAILMSSNSPTASNAPVDIDITDDSSISNDIQGLQRRKQELSQFLDSKELGKNAQQQIKSIDDQIKQRRKIAKEKSFSARALKTQSLEIDNITKLIEKVEKQADSFSTGLLGSALSLIPATDASDLSANLDTLNAYAGFSKLQQMRESSPTGGALGSVSERELQLLNSSIAALNQSQSSKQFKENLDRFKRNVQSSWNNVREAYKKDFGSLPKDITQDFTISNGEPSTTVIKFNAQGQRI